MQNQGSALAPFTHPVVTPANLSEPPTTWLESLPGIYQMHATRMAWAPFFEQCKTGGIVVKPTETDAELDALFQPE